MPLLHQRAAPRNTTYDLFGEIPGPYPDSPGSKGGETSREAARAIAPRAGTVRRLVLDAFKTIFPAALTADEMADRLDCSILTIRPRVSELHAAGLIEQTVQRRRNRSGMMAKVWRASSNSVRAAQ